jgi:hypothetical protein
MCPCLLFSSNAEIAAIGIGVVHRTLPKPAWTHAAHFAAAVWLVEARGLDRALLDMPGIIRAYNVATGVQNTPGGGYHETITLASVRAAGAHLDGRADLYVNVNDLLGSALGKPDWPLAYWSRERLFSVAARLAWCEPDVAPLPF